VLDAAEIGRPRVGEQDVGVQRCRRAGGPEVNEPVIADLLRLAAPRRPVLVEPVVRERSRSVIGAVLRMLGSKGPILEVEAFPARPATALPPSCVFRDPHIAACGRGPATKPPIARAVSDRHDILAKQARQRRQVGLAVSCNPVRGGAPADGRACENHRTVGNEVEATELGRCQRVDGTPRYRLFLVRQLH